MKDLASLYPAHLENVKNLYSDALATAEYNAVIIHGGALRYAFLDDHAYPFRMNPHLKYWLPVLDNPNCFLIYEPGQTPILLFYQAIDFWLKPAPAPLGFWTSHFDIRMIADPEDARQHLPKGERVAFIGEEHEGLHSWDLGKRNPASVLAHLDFNRAWKSDYEVECLREANRIAIKGHRVVARAFREGLSEFETHIEYLSATQHAEHELPYGNIIAHNENGSVLHYQHLTRSRPGPGEKRSFLVDAGATFHGYAADVTRTYSADSRDEMADLIAAVESFQQELCARVKPGVDYTALHLDAHRHVGATLKRFGIIDIDGDGAFEKGITSTFFPHGLGHYLGLQVHDVGGCLADRNGALIDKPAGHPFLRLTRVVSERESFTIEPGIYFITPLLAELKKSDNSRYVNWSRVEELQPYGGVRIEDDVIVTAGGHENLTREAFDQ
ncbi:MAG TPA: Xaa-Pro dipeptidase [Thermoanaerobaculia bacterium]|nr:Xaa-Pro dipeptidase [Thermoanaerobaculia bacterium]